MLTSPGKTEITFVLSNKTNMK